MVTKAILGACSPIGPKVNLPRRFGPRLPRWTHANRDGPDRDRLNRDLPDRDRLGGMDNILAAAQAIATARRNRTPLQSLPPEIAPNDEAEGYLIQRAVHDLLLPYEGGLVGYKIGCTSNVMQRYLGIPHPCGGGVFARGVHDSGASLRNKDFVRVGVECEIAVRLKRDLLPSEFPFTTEWVTEAIEAYYPAIEIVDDRYLKWQALGAP